MRLHWTLVPRCGLRRAQPHDLGWSCVQWSRWFGPAYPPCNAHDEFGVRRRLHDVDLAYPRRRRRDHGARSARSSAAAGIVPSSTQMRRD